MAQLLALLTGCLQPAPGQLEWHDRMLWASRTIDAAHTANLPGLGVQQLRAMIGEPDVRLSPSEFEQVLPGTPERRQEIMDWLRCEYRRYTRSGLASQPSRHETQRWPVCRFAACALFVYEESRRFTRPLPAWGWAPGFACYVFFVQDDMAMGMHRFIRWTPLQANGVKKDDRTASGCRPTPAGSCGAGG